MAQWLRAITTFVENLNLIPKHLCWQQLITTVTPAPGELMSSFSLWVPVYMLHTHIYIQINLIFFFLLRILFEKNFLLFLCVYMATRVHM